MKKIFITLLGTVLLGAFNTVGAAASENYDRIMVGCGTVNPIKENGEPLYRSTHWTEVNEKDYTVDLCSEIKPTCVGNVWDAEVVKEFPKNVKEVRFEHVGLGGLPIDYPDFFRRIVLYGFKTEDGLTVPRLADNSFAKPNDAMPLDCAENPDDFFSGKDMTACLKEYRNCLVEGGRFTYQSQRNICIPFNFLLKFEQGVTEEGMSRLSNFLVKAELPSAYDGKYSEVLKRTADDARPNFWVGMYLGGDGVRGGVNIGSIKKLDGNTVHVRGFFGHVVRFAHALLLEENGFCVQSVKHSKTTGSHGGNSDFTQVLTVEAKKK